jgi:sigma-B regulation protein RsbU (phosphoserine phosphatase)
MREAMQVLVADDDLLYRRLLSAALSAWGFSFEVVENGNHALELLAKADGPRIALFDWVMPGLEGPEVCRRLRTLPRQQLIYAILLTAKSSKQDIISGLQAGADDYMTKPFDREELFARLQVGVRVLTLQQSLSQRFQELAEALASVKQLQGLLPICCYCKNIRADDNYWQKVETYFAHHTDVQFSHGICPHCYEKVVEPELQRLKDERAVPLAS